MKVPSERVEVHPDFDRQIDTVFFRHVRHATYVRETRLLLAAPPLHKPSRLRFIVRDLVREGKLQILKLEQVCTLERAVEILCNAKVFGPNSYAVRLLPFI